MTESIDEVQSKLRDALQDPGHAPGGLPVAVRLRFRLQPAGGSGAKVMPPTYAGQGGPVYVEEMRAVDGETIYCISLDSVASQANRLEEAIEGEVVDGGLPLPTIWVDQHEYGVNSALKFSHRSFDAWVEDALLEDGTRFGDTDTFKALAGSKRGDLGELMAISPVSILLGAWASRVKNPQGAARLPRILTSELIAVGAQPGERASSRIDAHHVSAAIPVYRSEGSRFTVNADRAVKEKGKPVPYAAAGEKGKPSALGYGNVTPSLADHGGITMDHALQIATISLPALRECRFPEGGDRAPERDLAGRMMLATLGLRMLSAQVERGYDLRSGCLLVPEEEPTLELIDHVGQTVSSWPALSVPSSELLEAAIAAGAEQGIAWSKEGTSLTASEDQLDLLRQSLATKEVEEA